MRLGIVRHAAYLPAGSDQLTLLRECGCDQIVQVEGSDYVAERRVERALFRVGAGDELVLTSLGVLSRPGGFPATAVRNVLEAGATLLVPGEGRLRVISGSQPIAALLELLSEHERTHSQRRVRRPHQGGSRNPLSRYQIEYARKLYADGESLRNIGLLFQLPPAQVWEIVAPPHAHGGGVALADA